jgi:hypothetical protein
VTTLKQIGSTSLYAPPGGEQFAFLLWETPGEPQTIPLEDTWADDGPAARIGYHVFVDALPSGTDAVALAKELRAELPAPITTGLAWAISPPSDYKLLGVVPMTVSPDVQIAGADFPAVAADAAIEVPAPMPPLTIPRGLWATAGAAEPTGWVITSPRPTDPLSARGLSVALLGQASGGISFQALLEAPATPTSSVKPLAAVSIDPRYPFDPTRTSITPLGADYLVSMDVNGTYHLAPA